jgi:dolichyl-phosphate beta-glucosyltransferase
MLSKYPKMNSKKIAVSIIIPCYNEENNLKRGVLNQVKDYLKSQNYPWEVLICNDQSTDKSRQLLLGFVKDNPGFRLIDLPHGGKPVAIWTGIQQAIYPIILFTDMDQSTPLSEFSKLLPYFNQSYQAVIGSRGIHRQNFSLFRKLMSRVFFIFRRSMLLPHIDDTQCGFKAFDSKLIKKIFPHLAVIKNQNKQTGWRVSAYDVELLFIIDKLGLKIKEVEVNWKNEDTSTSKGSADRFNKESKLMAQEVIRVKLNDLKGAYNQIKAHN